MENREKVVSDYLKLRVMLNKTNPKANQKTEVDFIIVSKAKGHRILFASLIGSFNRPMLELCSCRHRNNWDVSGYSGLPYLEQFCTDFIMKKIKENSKDLPTEFIALALKSELKSLGISR